MNCCLNVLSLHHVMMMYLMDPSSQRSEKNPEATWISVQLRKAAWLKTPGSPNRARHRKLPILIHRNHGDFSGKPGNL